MIYVYYHWMPLGRYCQHYRLMETRRDADRYVCAMQRKYPNFVFDEFFIEEGHVPAPKEKPKKPPTEKERLEALVAAGEVRPEDITFGRKMSFGKFKDRYVYAVIAYNRGYVDWLLGNTSFRLTETEAWWKERTEAAGDDGDEAAENPPPDNNIN